MKKIRFLATGDIHSDQKLLKEIETKTNLSEIDFIILVGDISEKKDDFSKILEIFKGKQIFMVPGNHENKTKIKRLQDHYNVHLVGNSPVLIDNDLALFGTNYIPIGPYGISEQLIFDNLVDNYKAIKNSKFKIHLSHLPPAGTKISDSSKFFPFIGGSQAQRVFLEHFKPDYTLVGHIHETSGLEEIVNKTKVINVGRTFKIFEFDQDKKDLKILK